KLSRIALYRPKILCDLLLDLNGARKGLSDHSPKFREQVARLNRTAFPFPAAREGKHLPHHACATLGADFQGVNELQVSVVADFLAQKLRSHDDRRENIVQVVRDAAGQSANAFHALVPEKLCFD